MKNRIRAVRKAVGLNQTEFGQRLGLRQSAIASYETGYRTPLDTVLMSICREFSVSEHWFRTGEGDMFQPETRSAQIARFMGQIASDPEDAFRRRFVELLARMTPQEWDLVERKARELLGLDDEKDGQD